MKTIHGIGIRMRLSSLWAALAIVALVLGLSSAASPAAIGAPAPAVDLFAGPIAAAAANIDQCTNGAVGPPLVLNPCLNGTLSGVTYSDWVNGNSNGNKSHWREGEFISYRVTVSGISVGAHTITMHYDTVHGGKHAIDYLGSFDFTETTAITPTQFHRNNSNPCGDKLPSGQCNPAVPISSTPVVGPPTLSLVNCGGSAGTFNTANYISGSFKIYGPTGTTLNSMTYTGQNVPSGTGQCSTSLSLSFNLGSGGGSTVVIAWGGHIASQLDWGVGNSASFISGSPFHMALDTLDGASTGSQDRALATSAVFFTPSIATTIKDSSGNAVTSVTVGTTVHDTATLSNAAANAGGTVTYSRFNNFTCSGTAASTQTVNVTNAVVPDSSTFTPTAGLYSYQATYSGDSRDVGATSPCEPLTVGGVTPTLTTTASGPVTVGQAINDVAHLSGGFNPTGSISFNVYGPGDTTCSTPLTPQPAGATVNGAGDYTSGNFTTTAAGTYRWIASYSGDANNNPVSTSCNDANESSTVNKATPSLTTTASGPVIVGQGINDTAHLSGGFGPLSGSISFNVYGPGDTTCSTPLTPQPAGATVNGAGDYTSGSFTTTAAGTYRWIASYSGDANNNPVSTSCNDPGESSTVNPAQPSNSTAQNLLPNDSFTLSGGYNPTGSITFSLFAPSDASCSGTPAFTQTVSVSGNGTYSTSNTSFLATTVGTWRWFSIYSGDGNNLGTTSACGVENFTISNGS